MVVHNDVAQSVEFNTQLRQAKAVNQGSPSGCCHDKTGLQAFSVRQHDLIVGALSLNGFDGGVETQVDALFAHLLLGEPAHIVIKAPQEQITPVQQGGFHTKPGQYAGELYRYITATPDHGMTG